MASAWALCWLILGSTLTAAGGRKLRGESLVIFCVTNWTQRPPVSISFQRNWPESRHSELNSQRPVHSGQPYITFLSQLKDDTGLYKCELLYAEAVRDQAEAREVFFIVSGQSRWEACASYSTLLFTICGAVVFLVILAGVLLFSWHIQHCHRPPTSETMPIYEEMSTVATHKTNHQELPLENDHYAEGAEKAKVYANIMT